ncbi:hypothetical protein GUITHDRAFT_67022, partial [Guillardia theta CCMP2712]
DPVEREFCYVDEHTCIGCTNCAMIARSTFFMEESHGRARVFLQDGDSASAVEEAINSCPVDCIHPVTFQELQVSLPPWLPRSVGLYRSSKTKATTTLSTTSHDLW